MYRNENIKTQECIKKNGMINKGNKDTLTYEDLKKLDMDPYYKMSKKETIDILSYMLSSVYYSISDDLCAPIFSKTDRQELLNLTSKVLNKLKTIKY